MKFCLILVIFLFGCSLNKNEREPVSNVKNKYFSQQAELFFGVVLKDKMSFSSFSSDDVSYTIDMNYFDIEKFLKAKDGVLKENGWSYYKRYNDSYIFCNNIDQLEIIPPRELMGNKINFEGSLGMQLKNKWNILFAHPKNSTWYECNKK